MAGNLLKKSNVKQPLFSPENSGLLSWDDKKDAGSRLGPCTVGRRVCAVRAFCCEQNLGAVRIHFGSVKSFAQIGLQPLA